MCGIFGGIGKKVANNRNLMAALACFNMPRGTDSTGFFVIGSEFIKDKHKGRRIVKGAYSADDFVIQPEYKHVFELDNIATCGHVRSASVGRVTNENAHPFRSGGTVGCHNGTVNNLEDIRKICSSNFETDSEYLVWMLENTNNLNKARGQINLTYSKENDTTGATLHLVKAGNPLYVAVSPDEKEMVYSSEEGHLKKSLACNGILWDIMSLKEKEDMRIYLDDQVIVYKESDTFECDISHAYSYNKHTGS